MIAAYGTQDFVPFGREYVLQHPGEVQLQLKGSKVCSGHGLLERSFPDTSISDKDENTKEEQWQFRSEVSDGDDIQNEELYVCGNTVVWSRGSSASSRQVIKTFTVESPVLQADWCTFILPTSGEARKSTTPGLDSDAWRGMCDYKSCQKMVKLAVLQRCVCIVESSTVNVVTENGEDYTITLPFQVTKASVIKNGLLFERVIPHSEMTSPRRNATNLRTVFSMLHPLDEVSPVITRTVSGGTPKMLYLTDTSQHIVFTSITPSLCLTYDTMVGVHSVWIVRRAKQEEIYSATGLWDNAGFYHPGIGTPGAVNNQSSSTNSRLTSNLSSQSPSISPLRSYSGPQANSPITLSASKSPFSFFPPSSRTQSPSVATGNMFRIDTPSPQGRSPSVLYRTPSGSQNVSLINESFPEWVEPLTPDICLDHLWTEPALIVREGPAGQASKAFLLQDICGQTYLYYLVRYRKQLRCVKINESNDKSQLIFGSRSFILASDVLPIQELSMILIVDFYGHLVLYSGTTRITKVHIPELPVNTITLNLLQSATPVGSPQGGMVTSSRPSSAVDPRFGEGANMISPVLTEMDNSSHLEPSLTEEVNLPSNKMIVGLRDNIKRRFTVVSDETLRQCQSDSGFMQCPVSTCAQILSRKQTLKNHLMTIHRLQFETMPSRYKRYEVDDSVPVPRSTHYWKKKQTSGKLTDIPSPSAAHFDDFMPLLQEVRDENTALSYGEDNLTSHSDLTEVIQSSASDPNLVDMDISSDESEEIEEDIDHNDSELLSVLCKADPPLYVVENMTGLWNSSITKNEHELSVSAFACRHNLSDTGIRHLLELLQIHITPQNLGQKSVNKIKEFCGFSDTNLKYHYYCDYCKKLFSGKSEKCLTPECEGQFSDPKCKKYFMTSDLKLQMKEVLERDGIWHQIQNCRASGLASSLHMSDVRSGQVYKKLLDQGGFLDRTNNITFSLFTDGVPVFKSSGVSIWPVYILINEIPPKERFLRKNMLLWGVWQGVGKPNMNMFFKPLIIDLLDLYENGITLTVCDEVVNVKAMLLLITMDLPARAGVLNMTQHNGKYGCLYCMEPGISVPSGKGHCHAYPVRQPPAELRSDKAVRISSQKARKDGKRTDGFLGESVLLYLPYFSLLDNVVIDYMHGILIGVTKTFLGLWFDLQLVHEPFNIAGSITDIDKKLKNIHPPYMIHRHPRILSKTYHHWKASEMRNWLLFYSIPCLLGHLPDLYLTHFSCLVEATYILLGEGISEDDLSRADLLLKKFVENVPNLYPMRVMGINVHNLTHLVHCVRLHGPLWVYSCFAFESFNGELKRSIHGTGNICKQLFWVLQAQKRVEQKSRSLGDGPVNQFLKGMIGESSGLSGSNEAYQCSVAILKPLTVNISEDLMEQLRAIVGPCEQSDFKITSKIFRNGFVMYSSSLNKVKKQNSYTIGINNVTFGPTRAIEVQFYLMKEDSRRVYAVGKLLQSTQSFLPRRVPHLMRFTFSRQEELAVVKAEKLRAPLVVVRIGENICGGYLPNQFERD